MKNDIIERIVMEGETRKSSTKEETATTSIVALEGETKLSSANIIN